MSDLRHAELAPLFLQVARDARRHHFDRARIPDEKTLMLAAATWCDQHPRKLAEFLGEDTKAGTRALTAAMRNACRDYARKDRATRHGYHLDDDVFYRFKVLRDELLYAVYDVEAWYDSPVPAERRTHGSDPATRNNWVTTLADVSSAVGRIRPLERAFLLLFYEDRWPLEVIADHYEISDLAAERRWNSAVRQVHDKLGGPRPYNDPPEEVEDE